jgi:hypothetical protein
MKFAIADTFQRSLARLNGDEQTRAKAAVFDFQLNPASPGFSYERLQRAKDPNFRSARVSSDLRFIVHQMGENICACYVGHHDEAYRWAERHKQEVHPVTGAMQIVEVVERTEEVVRRIVREELVVPPLFRNYEKDYLLALGIPEVWLDAVMAVSDDGGLLELVSHLPQEAGERLLELADGKPVSRPESLQHVNPYEHPDAQRRFKTIDSKDALREALEFPWEQWVVFLHPTQRRVVERTYRGPARVSGAAGTGKTVVALHRAAWLARKHPEASVLLTTFSRTLAFRLGHQADILLSAEKEVRDRITIDHVHKLARDIWAGGSGKRFQALDSDTLNQCLERASRAHKADFPLSFIRSEWDAVVQPGGITSWAEYKGAPRTNRGTPLGARQRQALWKVFETTLKSLDERGLMSWDRLCLEAAKMGAGGHRFGYVIADEYQDLGPAELVFLRSLAPEANDALFLCGDSGQRIYKGRTSWLSLGIDVRGRSSSLTVNYRTTEQIRRFADRILKEVTEGGTGETEDRRSVSLLSGPEPRVQAYGTTAEEIEGVSSTIRGLLAEGYQPGDIAVFAHGQAPLKERVEAACSRAGVPCRELSDESPVSEDAISIGTMHRAKGLEFKAVIVLGCEEKLLPMRALLDRLSDPADRDAFIEQEKHLLYVACTRARERLVVTHSGPKSRFLP